MTDLPILFSGPMVRALLAGSKTQTRRVLSNNKPLSLFNGMWADSYVLDPGNAEWRQKDLRFALGDHLYVREAWRVGYEFESTSPRNLIPGAMPVLYEADASHTMTWPGRFRQGMHMPRWASRLTLIVTDVRVQRLQHISPYDALAEGVCAKEQDGQPPDEREVKAYADLWDSLNADRGYGWAANPWVVAYSFTVQHGNIDQIGRAA